MENPFNVNFGKAPTQIVSREEELSTVLTTLTSDNPSSNTYVITGPRGCGKTVALSLLLNEIRTHKDFVVVRLTESSNILEQLAGLLYEEGRAKKLFLKADFNVSFYGVSLSIHGENPVSNVEALLRHIFQYFKRKGIKVLLAVDDVAKSDELIGFVRAYQGFLIDGFDVRLLLSGLYNNIVSLEREKSLTFLTRATRVVLSPLSLPRIADSYCTIFDIPLESGAQLAKVTAGYAYAYQLLGNILFRDNKKAVDNKVLKELDEKLEEGCYHFLWTDLSQKEVLILRLIAHGHTVSSAIQELMAVNKGYFSVYRKRLIDCGLIKEAGRGKVAFALPRFKEFVLRRELFDDLPSLD